MSSENEEMDLFQDPVWRKAAYRSVVRKTSIDQSVDLQMMATPDLLDWLQQNDLTTLGSIADFCLAAPSQPLVQAELLRFSMDDRRALAKILSKVEPIEGRPMLRWLLDPSDQTLDRPND